MTEPVPAGTWVQIRDELVPAGQRAAAVPEDTAATPFMMRVRGWLSESARLGVRGRVTTLSGRTAEGIVELVNPGHNHGFGLSDPSLKHLDRYRAE